MDTLLNFIYISRGCEAGREMNEQSPMLIMQQECVSMWPLRESARDLSILSLPTKKFLMTSPAGDVITGELLNPKTIVRN